MIKFCRFFILAVILMSAVNLAFAQKKVDLGQLRQNTYTNDFFELRIEFPFGWLVGDNTLEAQLLEIQKQMVKASDPKNQAAVNKAINRLVPLLGGYRALPGSRADNSNLKIVVESLATTPKIKTSRDYLNKVKSSLNIVKLPPDYQVSDIKTEMIDGKTLDYLEIKYGANHKRNYVMMKKGYAVLLTIDAYSQKDFTELHQILTEADLDYKKGN